MEIFKVLKKTLLVLMLTCSAPAWAGRIVQTPSGQVEGFYKDKTLEEAQAAIASKCMDASMPVQRTSYSVRCQRVMSKLEQAFQNALTSPRYASDSKDIIEFNLVQIENGTRVQVRRWQEYTTAFGQYNQIPLDNDDFYNQNINFMLFTGARLPIGSRFPNTPYWGVNWKDASVNIDGKKKKGLEIVEVVEKSPAYASGIRVGDFVFAINGKAVPTYKAAGRAIDSVPLGQICNVSVFRGGAILTIAVVSQKRHDIISYNEEASYEVHQEK